MNPNDAVLSLAGIGFSGFGLLLLLLVLLSLSAFVKIATVLGVLRAGLGVWSLPSAFVTGALALLLSFFVMYPTVSNSLDAASRAIAQNRGLSPDQQRVVALEAGFAEWKTFLQKHVHPGELEDFAGVAEALDRTAAAPAEKPSETGPAVRESWRVLAPAFVVSELKEAFSIGLRLFLPLLVIDLLVANVLTLLGYVSLSPTLVALPFKLLLFVLVDGWTLITTNLVSSYVS